MHISKNIPNREQFITHFQEYIKGIAAWHEQGHMFCIFSSEGVRQFPESQKIDEHPPDVYLPFEIQDRIYFVKKLIQSCKNMHYRMLRNNIGDPEHGLLFTFYDAFENLADEMFYTYEETAALLNNLIE